MEQDQKLARQQLEMFRAKSAHNNQSSISGGEANVGSNPKQPAVDELSNSSNNDVYEKATDDLGPQQPPVDELSNTSTSTSEDVDIEESENSDQQQLASSESSTTSTKDSSNEE